MFVWQLRHLAAEVNVRRSTSQALSQCESKTSEKTTQINTKSQYKYLKNILLSSLKSLFHSSLFLIQKNHQYCPFSSLGFSLGLREAVRVDTTQATRVLPLRGIGDRPSGLAISGTAIPFNALNALAGVKKCRNPVGLSGCRCHLTLAVS